MNPILPREFFIPDVEARHVPDGRLYFYGSTDNPAGQFINAKPVVGAD